MVMDEQPDRTPEERPETDTTFHVGDVVEITQGNFLGKIGKVVRVSYGGTIYYEVHNADAETQPFPPIYLSASQIKAVA